jgi:branched-chain amino acid transport system substrate-binding protein
MPRGTPVRIGVLLDFPQADGGAATETALRLGIAEVSDAGRLDREIELVTRPVAGLPLGSEHDVVEGFRELADTGCVLVVGPSISDNALITTPIGDEIGLVTINYTGGERTRGHFGFHYQVGSLEEEPVALAGRLVERGVERPAVIHDQSPVGRRYAECFDDAATAAGLEVAARRAISPLIEDATAAVTRLLEAGPDAVVYLGLGMSSRPVALALAHAAWNRPVLANSALMFGYARPDWRDGWAGWEYLDAIADDNERRQALAAHQPSLAAAPVPCALVDIGRLAAEAVARADHLTREGIRDALERIKRLPAACGYEGTTMGFGVYEHAALAGEYLVLREWREGRTVQVVR